MASEPIATHVSIRHQGFVLWNKQQEEVQDKIFRYEEEVSESEDPVYSFPPSGPPTKKPRLDTAKRTSMPMAGSSSSDIQRETVEESLSKESTSYFNGLHLVRSLHRYSLKRLGSDLSSLSFPDVILPLKI